MVAVPGGLVTVRITAGRFVHKWAKSANLILVAAYFILCGVMPKANRAKTAPFAGEER